MKFLLATILRAQRGDRGFALPTALGFGLVILLVASALLLRSQDDRVDASIQRASSSSLNVTEGGITRLQAFIDANRPVATYNLSQWLTASTSMTNLSVCSNPTPATVEAFATAATTWQNIDPADASKGQFRLANYTYIADNTAQPHSTPGRGILEVEGRLPDQQSVNRVRITIPVQPGDVIGVPVPGVWVVTGGTQNNTIEGNMLLNDCSVSPSQVRITGDDPRTGLPYQMRHTNIRLPALPTRPLPALNSLPSTTIDSNITLPRLTDVPVTRTVNGQTVQVYEYDVSNLNIANNKTLTITPGRRVTFYLTGNIERGGDIVHSCDGVPASTGCQPTNFQIFGYGPTGSYICTNGVGYIDAFILAPNYYAGVAGSGGGQGGIRGAVWVGDWSNGSGCGSNTTNITVRQTADWNAIGLTPQNLPPKLAAASTWERQTLP
jgi:hypothetical protein